VYDLPTGQEVQRLSPGLPGFGIRFDPAGRRLAVSGFDTGTVQVWDLDTGKLLRALPHSSSILGVAWHPGGKLLAVAANRQVCLWQADTGRPQAVLDGFGSQASRVAFGPDDLLASYGWDLCTRLWDAGTGRQLLSVFGAQALHFRPGGRELAFVSALDVPVEAGVWEVTCGKGSLRALPNPGADPHWPVDVHPSWPVLAVARPNGVALWDLAAGREVPFPDTGEWGWPLFSPDGHSLLTVGPGRARRWPLDLAVAATGARVTVGPPQDLGLSDGGVKPGPGLSFSRDGRKLAAIHPGRGEVSVLDLRSGARRALTSDYPRVANVTISPDGRWVAAGNRRGAGVKVWEAEAGDLAADLPTPGNAAALFSPDGKWLAVCAAGEGYVLREPGSWRIVRVLPGNNFLGYGGMMAFSPDGKVLAVDSHPTDVKLVDPGTGRELATLPQGGVHLRFSPDGSQLAATADQGNFVWDLRRAREQLAAMGLDWDQPPYPPATAVGAP
jgi:WD40 repeat protein